MNTNNTNAAKTNETYAIQFRLGGEWITAMRVYSAREAVNAANKIRAAFPHQGVRYVCE